MMVMNTSERKIPSRSIDVSCTVMAQLNFSLHKIVEPMHFQTASRNNYSTFSNYMVFCKRIELLLCW